MNARLTRAAMTKTLAWTRPADEGTAALGGKSQERRAMTETKHSSLAIRKSVCRRHRAPTPKGGERVHRKGTEREKEVGDLGHSLTDEREAVSLRKELRDMRKGERAGRRRKEASPSHTAPVCLPPLETRRARRGRGLGGRGGRKDAGEREDAAKNGSRLVENFLAARRLPQGQVALQITRGREPVRGKVVGVKEKNPSPEAGKKPNWTRVAAPRCEDFPREPHC